MAEIQACGTGTTHIRPRLRRLWAIEEIKAAALPLSIPHHRAQQAQDGLEHDLLSQGTTTTELASPIMKTASKNKTKESPAKTFESKPKQPTSQTTPARSKASTGASAQSRSTLRLMKRRTETGATASKTSKPSKNQSTNSSGASTAETVIFAPKCGTDGPNCGHRSRKGRTGR